MKVWAWTGTRLELRGYSNGGPAVRVDTPGGLVIIAVVGKLGKPPSLSCNFRNPSGLRSNSSDPPAVPDRATPGRPTDGERQIRDDFGPRRLHGGASPGPNSCDWPRASKGWTNA